MITLIRELTVIFDYRYIPDRAEVRVLLMHIPVLSQSFDAVPWDVNEVYY